MRRAAKIDSTARELTALARQMGAQVLPLNGVIDALLLHRGRVFLVDWKTARGKRITRTTRQEVLAHFGWPIHFISTPEELRALVTR